MPSPSFFLRSVALAAALLPGLSRAAPLTLDQALERAVQRSESARAARAGATSATEAARAAGQLPDPVLRAGVDNLPISGTDRLSSRDSMTMKRVGISQEWLSAEKRAARQAAADAMAGREAVAVQATTAEVRLQAGLAYLDAWFAGETLKLTALTEHHAREELEAARARLASATGNGQEVLALAAAQGVAEDEAAEVRQQQAAARAALERWMGAPAEELAEPAGLPPPQEQAYVASHPAVLAAQLDAELARKEAELARASRNPNWSWELSYGQRAGYPDMVSVGVSIPLVVAPARRQDRDIASRLALIEKAEAALAEATRMATGEYRALAGDAGRLAERIERYRATVAVAARQRTSAAQAAYRSNQAPLMTLFEARHAEVQAQRRLLALQRELARAQVQLALKPILEGGAR
ncbi:outer membrane protein TolC [Pelomonas saccharophila]|uniref:Outer membrane protein TolC n=1 Tax=Roseateles saccharophilus TaxID=304 RepID=A0ABU1YVY9_ROSSA|nr:TolC family protein [Roseateles saccharophilus]MDR7273017.1 outer membrane protein TolC [Roseateles saccharophilus]